MKVRTKQNTKVDKKKDETKQAKKPMISRSCQDLLDFVDITKDGIIITNNGGSYSKLYYLVDSNFVTEPDEKQEDILSNYTKFVNKFPDNVTISIVIVNKQNTMQQMIDAYHLKPCGDNYDTYRSDYNKIIDAKIDEGHNDISKEKYILMTAHARTIDEAEMAFNVVDVSLQESIRTINKIGVRQVTAKERLRIMHANLRGNEGLPFERDYDR